MSERREEDRRQNDAVSEPLERRGERRGSPRVPARLTVWTTEQGVVDCDGELGLGGASFVTASPPGRGVVLVRAELPGGELTADATVVGRSSQDDETVVRVAFGALPAEAELELARWLDER